MSADTIPADLMRAAECALDKTAWKMVPVKDWDDAVVIIAHAILSERPQWNTDISAAPRGKTVTRTVKTKDGFKDVPDPVIERVWLASKCGKVVLSHWVDSRSAWSGFADKEQPVAWYPYLVPVHPFAAATQGEAAVSPAPMHVSLPDTDERSGEGANAGGSHVTTGRNAHPQPSAVEPVSSSTEFAYLEDAGSGQ